jgi:hypothetical protein
MPDYPFSRSPDVHLATSISLEAAHHLVTLHNTQLQTIPWEHQWGGPVPSVSSDNFADFGTNISSKFVLELEEVWSGDSNVEEPETVPLGLQGHFRPRDSIHGVDVTCGMARRSTTRHGIQQPSNMHPV